MQSAIVVVARGRRREEDLGERQFRRVLDDDDEQSVRRALADADPVRLAGLLKFHAAMVGNADANEGHSILRST